MTDHDPASQVTDAQDGENGDRLSFSRLLFGIAALAFLAYLAIGSIEARIWRFGRIYFEDRSVREVWAYFGDRLPDMPGQPVISALYWISLAVMVVGSIVGLWLFLGSEDDDPSHDPHTHDLGATSTHV